VRNDEQIGTFAGRCPPNERVFGILNTHWLDDDFDAVLFGELLGKLGDDRQALIVGPDGELRAFLGDRTAHAGYQDG